jgi:hypothetical protein
MANKENQKMQYKFIQRPLAAIALSFAAGIASAEPGLVVSNGSKSITMDSSALNALPNVFFETSTIWTNGVISFSGPSLHSIIEQVGILGSSFKCNTQSPLGIGCCDGHTKQAPQQRGPWRDISRA